MKWCGHVLRREEEYVGKRVMVIEVPGKSRRGRPKRRWLDNTRNDLSEIELSGEEAQDQVKWERGCRRRMKGINLKEVTLVLISKTVSPIFLISVTLSLHSKLCILLNIFERLHIIKRAVTFCKILNNIRRLLMRSQNCKPRPAYSDT